MLPHGDPAIIHKVRAMLGFLIAIALSFGLPSAALSQRVAPSEFTLTAAIPGTNAALVLHVQRTAGTFTTRLKTPWGATVFSSGLQKSVPANGIPVFAGEVANPRPPHERVTFLKGQTGSAVRRLQLLCQDGTRIDVPIRNGYVLYVLSQHRLTLGHAPIELIARGRSGAVVAARYTSAY